jgi:hypothetical protein
MVGISSVGGTSSSITQMLQRLAGNQETSEAGRRRPPGPPTEEMQAEMDQKFEETLQSMGIDDETIAKIQDEIKSAVSEAVDSQGEDANSRDAVRDAVDSVLQKYGVDLDEFKSQFKPPAGGMGPPREESNSSTTDDESSSSDNRLLSYLNSNSNDITSALLKSLLPLVNETA